jgi:uncharacterized membrane-anchored protein YhcB (DUF1043 family)
MVEKVTKEEKLVELAIAKAKKLIQDFKDGTTVRLEGDLQGEEQKVKKPKKNPTEEKLNNPVGDEGYGYVGKMKAGDYISEWGDDDTIEDKMEERQKLSSQLTESQNLILGTEGEERRRISARIKALNTRLLALDNTIAKQIVGSEFRPDDAPQEVKIQLSEIASRLDDISDSYEKLRKNMSNKNRTQTVKSYKTIRNVERQLIARREQIIEEWSTGISKAIKAIKNILSKELIHKVKDTDLPAKWNKEINKPPYGSGSDESAPYGYEMGFKSCPHCGGSGRIETKVPKGSPASTA